MSPLAIHVLHALQGIQALEDIAPLEAIKKLPGGGARVDLVAGEGGIRYEYGLYCAWNIVVLLLSCCLLAVSFPRRHVLTGKKS